MEHTRGGYRGQRAFGSPQGVDFERIDRAAIHAITRGILTSPFLS